MGQNKIAIINDMTGFGRCSLTVQLPIISALKIQAVPVITSILSCHMQFPHYYIDDYTLKMKDYIQSYKDNHLSFEGIMSGYLGNSLQADIVIDFIKSFKEHNQFVLIDPVMGDHGHLYSTMNKDMIEKMKELVTYGHILTPNVTELCALTDYPYSSSLSLETIHTLCKTLCVADIKHIIVTGIKEQDYLINYIYNYDNTYHIVKTKKIGKDRCGSGDVLSAVIAGEYLNTSDIVKSVNKAVSFTSACIQRCEELEIPHHYGLCIEEYLKEL